MRASTSLIRDRAHRRAPRRSTTWSCRCPASTTSRTPLAAIAVAHQLGIADDAIRRGARRLRRRQAALHPHRHVERRRRHRRLRPPPGRDRRRAEGGARRSTAGSRSSPSCSRIATRGSATCSTEFCDLLQRCRHGHRGAGLCGRRGADRGHRPRRAGRGLAPPRPPRRAALSGPDALAPMIAGARAARRLRRLPWRRLDHAVGLRAARPNWRSSTRRPRFAYERSPKPPLPRHNPARPVCRRTRAIKSVVSNGEARRIRRLSDRGRGTTTGPTAILTLQSTSRTGIYVFRSST